MDCVIIGICANCRMILDEYTILCLFIVEKYGIPMSLLLECVVEKLLIDCSKNGIWLLKTEDGIVEKLSIDCSKNGIRLLKTEDGIIEI